MALWTGALGLLAFLQLAPEVAVSNDPAQIFSEVSIAVDRANPLRLIAASNNWSTSVILLYSSADGGATWTATPMPRGAASSLVDPGVAWDSRGTVYASSVSPADGLVQLARSTDGGRSWSDPPLVISARAYADKELLAVNDRPTSACRDLACVAWVDEVLLPRISCAPQGLGPWAERQLLTAGIVTAPIPVFGPDSEIFVAWTSNANQLEVVRSEDCGTSWSAPARIAGTRARDLVRLPAKCGPQGALVYPALDVDRSDGPRRGALYVVWTDREEASSCSPLCDPGCRADVFFSRSEDGARTWSAPIAVHSAIPGSDQFHPWLAVDDTTGTIHVAWYDTRNDPSRRLVDVYYRHSVDGGRTWDPESRVTSIPSDLSRTRADYNGLAAHACRVWAAWTDRRDNGNDRILAAALSMGSPGVPPPGIGNSLRGAGTALDQVRLSWTDAGAGEVDYRVYLGASKDPAAIAPAPSGRAGGADVITYLDPAPPRGPGAWFYRVRPAGPCGAESTSW